MSLDIIDLKVQNMLDRQKGPISGYLSLFGFVVMSLSRNGLFTSSGSRPNLDGPGEGWYRPEGVPYGLCGVQSHLYEGLSRRMEHHKDIVQPYCMKKYGHEWCV